MGEVYLVTKREVGGRTDAFIVEEVWDSKGSALARMNQYAHEDAARLRDFIPSKKTRVKTFAGNKMLVTVEKWVKVEYQRYGGKWVPVRDFVVYAHQLRTNVIERLAEIGCE